MQRIVSLALVIALMMTYMMTPTVYAQDIEVNYFYRTWARTDKVVADRQVDRTWMWGPESRGVAFLEPYADSPAGTRIVQYFDKSRMEISHPDRTPDPVWYVTNGLLVVELVTGELQTGDRQFVTREPADINVAGDLDHPASPTYRLFGTLMDDHTGQQDAPIGRFIYRDGSVGEVGSYRLRAEELNVRDAWYVPDTGHYVASPFWEFMNSEGLVHEYSLVLGLGYETTDVLFESSFYATGFPITEAYWSEVMVGGSIRDVLVQCFERRCLTYTPDNPPGWNVESGNVGQHYYQWAYGSDTTPPTPAASLSIADLGYTIQGYPNDVPETEYVSIRNNAADAVQLTGWSIWDGENQYWYDFPDVILLPGASITVHNCEGTDTSTDLYAGLCDTWFNGGDYVLLLDPARTVVDYEWRSLQ